MDEIVTDQSHSPALQVRGLTKRYGDAIVLRDVDLELAPGEVRALLGENGAGKSTLIKIVSGVVRPTAGEIEVGGKSMSFHDPRDADAAGISTLHQELAVAPGLSVAENVSLGRNVASRFGIVRWRELNRIARDVFADLHFDIDVTQDAATLSPIGKTMTSIARAISQDSKVLILDEPTASLTDHETEQLLSVVERVAANGVAVLYVSHRLAEVFRVADTFSILRNGELVGQGDVADTTVDEVITTMSGRSIDAIFPDRPDTTSPDTTGPDSGDTASGPSFVVDELAGHGVGPVSFEVAAGEILGIAGLAGAGRSTLLAMIAGVDRPHSGSMQLFGEPYSVRSVGQAHRRGVVLVPEERRALGLIPDTVERNLNVTTLDRHTVGRLAMSTASERDHAQRQWDTYDVRGASLDQDAFRLSGGNQQKVVLAKYLTLDPRLILLDEPTRGVDVGTKSEIYRLMIDRARSGAAVIVVSSELPELLGLCDRIAVLHEGHLNGIFNARDVSETSLLAACYGKAA